MTGGPGAATMKSAMGATTVSLKVKNPTEPKCEVEEEFLVDSGAVFTVLPENLVKKLKLKPVYEKKFVLADGKVIKRKIGSALIEFQGKEIPSPVVLGKEKDSRLLGALTLESFGLALDPFARKLYRAKMML